jgi:hypothetical protein
MPRHRLENWWRPAGESGKATVRSG